MKTRSYVMTVRAAKAEGNRDRIRLAAMQLYRERAIEAFTLDEVAARAGTTVQTVLRAFGSKEKLIIAAMNELAAGGTPLRPTRPGDVAAGVAALFDLYESIGDMVIQRLADERRHPAMKPDLDQGRENHRDAIRTMFAPQLAAVTGPARAQLLHALLAVTDVYVWKLLRRDQELGRAAAEAIVCRLIEGVTQWENAHGQVSVAELVGRRKPAS
jgi:AcrR family transcriptional regulator